MPVTIVKISWNAQKFPGKIYFPILLHRAKLPEINNFFFFFCAKFPEIRKFPKNWHLYINIRIFGIKLKSYSTAVFFHCFLACTFQFLRSWASIQQIDIKTLFEEQCLQWVLKKSTSRAFHAHDTWSYWSSENALHERFIAERWHWVSMEMLQLTARLWKNASILVWIQL